MTRRAALAWLSCALAVVSCDKPESTRAKKLKAAREVLAKAGYAIGPEHLVLVIGVDRSPRAHAIGGAVRDDLRKQLGIQARIEVRPADELESALLSRELELALVPQLRVSDEPTSGSEDSAVPESRRIPLLARRRQDLVQPDVEGFAVGPLGQVDLAQLARPGGPLRVSAPPLDSLDPDVTALRPAHALLAAVGANLALLIERADFSLGSVTITLRDAKWHDGQPITADDVLTGWRRALDPRRPSAVERDFACVVGAREYHYGQLDALEVRAASQRVLEVRLTRPCPELRAGFALAPFWPVPRERVEAHGSRWTLPANHLSGGPYRLVAMDGPRVHLEANPMWPTPPRQPSLELTLEDPAEGKRLFALSARDVVIAPAGVVTDVLLVGERGKVLARADVTHAISLAINRAALAELTGDVSAGALLP